MKKIVYEKQKDNIISLDDLIFDQKKIYILRSNITGEIYKLHAVNHNVKSDNYIYNEYAFIAISDSVYFFNGTHIKAKILMKQCLEGDNEIFEFNSFKDFLEWVAKEYLI